MFDELDFLDKLVMLLDDRRKNNWKTREETVKMESDVYLESMDVTLAT